MIEIGTVSFDREKGDSQIYHVLGVRSTAGQRKLWYARRKTMQRHVHTARTNQQHPGRYPLLSLKTKFSVHVPRDTHSDLDENVVVTC